MRLPSPYKCDGCGAIRGETNHWWVGFICRFPHGARLTVWANEDLEDADGHFCGVECGMKWVSQVLAKINNKEKENNAPENHPTGNV